jgi:hypothetical protein
MKPRITGLHHDHIDGSLPVVKILPELYELSGMNNLLPTMGIGEGIDELVQFFQNPQEDIVKRFGLVTGGLQTTESIRRATREYAKTRAREGFRYVEAYFAPQYHTKFLSMRKVAYEFVTSLKSAADDYDMRIFPHICIGREADADTGIEIAKIALEFDGEVALNLVSPHISLRLGVRCDVIVMRASGCIVNHARPIVVVYSTTSVRRFLTCDVMVLAMRFHWLTMSISYSMWQTTAFVSQAALFPISDADSSPRCMTYALIIFWMRACATRSILMMIFSFPQCQK